MAPETFGTGRRTRLRRHLQFHHPSGRKRQHLADKISVGIRRAVLSLEGPLFRLTLDQLDRGRSIVGQFKITQTRPTNGA